MEIKLITTDVTTSGVGVGFRLLGNVEIKKAPILFGTTKKSYQTVGFRFNNVETTVDSNDDGYFELYRDSDEPITQFSTGTNNNLLKTLNVSNLDTSQITDMNSMFIECMGLTSLDVSHFDTSRVTNMSNMFIACIGLTSLNLSNWDTSKVTNMSNMFNYCTSLTSLDLSNWNTSQVTNMSNMFDGCTSLRTITINDEASANKLLTKLGETATWDPKTKEITIPV